MFMFMAASSAMAASIISAPENPATGIWIQQVGDIVPHASSKATLYYTKYQNDGKGDRVKGISYQYNGAGYLLMKPSDKKVVCYNSEYTSKGKCANNAKCHDGIGGADGIVQHPDGDLMVAGQGTSVFKVNKTVGADGKCVVKTSTPAQNTQGFWHLMMDPTQKILWGAGIPGYLFRFSTVMDKSIDNNISDKGYQVKLVPDAGNRRKDDKLATIVWDGDGTAFFTYSDYLGGGCEITNGPGDCPESKRKERRAGSYFGYFKDTTYTTVTNSNIGTYGGKVGDRVIKSFGTKILIDSLEGAHGATYDEYSKTIFVFGGSKIVQIKPYRENGVQKAKVVAEINLREFFFDETLDNLTLPRTNDGGYIGWRLDQGTVDGYGHLFVASNTGHMIFVDYVGNTEKLISSNVLVHVQWIDNYLDDVAPLKGVIVDRVGGTNGSDGELSSSASQSSSSPIIYQGSSSSQKTSSSSKVNSSGSTAKSSGSVGGSSNSTGKSSGSVGGSSGSTGNSSGSVGGSSGSTGNSSGSVGGSSGSTGNSSGSVGGSSGSTGNSSGSVGGSSGSTGKSSGSNSGSNSSSSKNVGNGEDVGDKSSSSRVYYGAEDWEVDSGSEFESYPSAEAFDKGDSVVAGVVILEPTSPDPKNPNIIKINGNYYLLNDKPKGNPLDLRYDSDTDPAKVGQVVAITLNPDKVKKYFGDVDSLTVYSETEITLIDKDKGVTSQTIKVNADGSVTIFVTSDVAVNGGAIKVRGGSEMVIIDNINFFDPIPDTRVGYIKDTDGDNTLDYVEVLLAEPVSKNYDLERVWILLGKDSILCTNPKMNEARDRILVDVSDLTLPGVGKFPEDAKALISYGDKAGTGAVYYRQSSIVEVGSFVIRDAFAIRNANGMDSLFLQFNVDLIPADVNSPEMLIMIKQNAERYGFDANQIKKVYMPTRDIVILVAKTFDLKGGKKDSVSLFPNVTFSKLPYITSDEYDREVPVDVMDRFASAKNVEYWDRDGDGVLDQIVTVFNKKLTSEDLKESVYMSFPWYSSRGMLIQLQAQPSELIIDPKDSTRVIWNVHSATKLASGVTSIREDLPSASIFTYYKVFGETFVSEENAPLVDKMSPVVSQAFLSYGAKADTLIITFSEAVLKPKGEDYFSFIHGGETIDLDPMRMDWASDGFSVKLILDGKVATIMPGDSLVVRKGAKDAIKDNYGNIAGEQPQPVIIGGLLNHLVETTNMGVFDANDDRIVDEDSNKTYTLQTVSSVNLRYVPGSTTKEDLEKEGALGHLVQLGERFVPQLLDRAQVAADGSYDPSVLQSIDSSNVFISFIVNYFDHLGQYVNDSIITVPCNSPKFGGNCLNTDKKVFVNWNFKDHNGRFVGTGVYNVQFKMVVRYENKKIEEEVKDKWGVRRKKSKHKK